MRWLRWLGVTVLLLAPIAVVVAIARPSDGSTRRADTRAEGSGPGGALIVGDDVRGEVGFREVAEYGLVGDGPVTVGVQGDQPFDAQLRIRDGDGDTVADIDDTNGLDPEARLTLDEGEAYVVDVQGFDGAAGSFTVYVE